MNKIIVFDTTLRDGEQSPGAAMDIYQKVEIAHCLADMGVNVIEAGFPVSSHKQFQATQIIAKEVKGTIIAGLARALHKDIDATAQAIKHSEHPRIHTFLSTSPIHRKYKLKKSKEEIIQITKDAVKYARNLVAEVEFSPEDATRTEYDFLAQVVETAINAGATTINIPDTVGYATPTECADIIAYLQSNVPHIDKCILSVHCHNDLGMAVANTLAAVKAGARQIEVTINGIGERAGNAALEEVIMALEVRKDYWNVECSIVTEKIYPLAKLLSNTIGFPIARNKAIIGDNAFSHEAGIHQDGILKHRATYEILTPEKIGRQKNSIVLGRHSGLHGFKGKLKELKIHVDDNKIPELFEKFSVLADKKQEIYNEDLYALVSSVSQDTPKLVRLKKVEVHMNPSSPPKAEITIETQNGEIKQGKSIGDGPVDAIFSSILNAYNKNIKLISYRVQSITPGKDAVGKVVVELEIENNFYTGNASSTDILQASAEAYISAINNYLTGV